ncbi:MAG: DUF4181 domain-containing protein [Alkalicoccus sp.]|nr:MAG: DUF4181 domain-containing protein [Alkalicoccus sp.]
MFIIFLIAILTGTWLLLRAGVKQLFGIREADSGFFEEAVTAAHQKIRIALSICYLLLTTFFLYTIFNITLLPTVLMLLVVLIMLDGASRIYFELNHSTEPKRAALTVLDTVVIVSALVFGITQLS